MLTPVPRAPHPHARRVPQSGAVIDHALAADRRHAALVVSAHRMARPDRPPSWLRWLELRLQPGQKVF